MTTCLEFYHFHAILQCENISSSRHHCNRQPWLQRGKYPLQPWLIVHLCFSQCFNRHWLVLYFVTWLEDNQRNYGKSHFFKRSVDKIIMNFCLVVSFKCCGIFKNCKIFGCACSKRKWVANITIWKSGIIREFCQLEPILFLILKSKFPKFNILFSVP